MKELHSERSIKLVTQNPKCSILTVEDYMKWYDLYLVNKQGDVTSVNYSDDAKISEILSDNWFDHCITPRGFLELAMELEAKVDMASYTKVIEMFISNYYTTEEDPVEQEIDEKYMPSDELKLAVLIQEEGA